MDKKSKKIAVIVFIFLFLAVFLRIFNLGMPFFGDEAWHEFAKFQKGEIFSVNYDSIKGKNITIEDPPLTGWFYVFYTSIFGFSTIIMRSSSVVFALVNIFLVYLLAKRIFDVKTAVFSAFLMIFSYWNCFDSYTFNRDGLFLMFFYLIIIFLYVIYRQSGSKKYSLLILAAVISMPYILIKISGVFITGILFLMILLDNGVFHELWKNRKHFWIFKKYRKNKFAKAVLEIIPFVLANFVAYLLLAIGSWIWNKPYFEILFRSGEIAPLEFFGGPIVQSVGREVIYLFLYGSPLLIGLTILSLIYFNKKKYLFVFWLLVPIIIYAKLPYAGALERYLSVIIPALCILSGSYLAKIKIDKLRLRILIVLGIGYFLLLNLFSLIKSEYLVHSIKEYGIRAVTLDWNFLFPFYGAGGPTFLIPFWTIAISFWLSFIFLTVAIMFYRKKKIFYLIFMCFLAVSGAFNLYVLQEFNFSLHAPSVNKGFNELLDRLDYENASVVYTNIGAIRIYHDDSIKFVYLRCPKKNTLCLDKYGELIRRFGGAAYIIDFPQRFENSQYYDLLEDNCELREKISDKQAVLGYIYDCEKQLFKKT
jgi:hypothetical protein